ncbi:MULTISPECIES: hypothetical protein [Pacificibacter]|uniref:hypothetical protein n=1 Tax=Pacificibacter TaxID=1042323 RepID=UPI001C0970F7|nr:MULTISPECIES: hypothetical protein [Pacificibacter]MBU2936357.1 hypothetical protein [Pacificibacter marinus]MDO6616605.1 hypothetical protein [Pacificibacter sp. 1_MG-2023]
MLKPVVILMGLSFAAPVFAQSCAPFMGDPLDGFTPLDATAYLDLPDSNVVRVTSPIETAITNEIVAGNVSRASKTWCQISIQRMIVDFEVPVEDDAISAMITRAIYIWNAQDDPVGWQISQLAERPRCARGDDPFAALCP